MLKHANSHANLVNARGIFLHSLLHTLIPMSFLLIMLPSLHMLEMQNEESLVFATNASNVNQIIEIMFQIPEYNSSNKHY